MIIEEVIDPNAPCRRPVAEADDETEDIHSALVEMMNLGWSENAADRPSCDDMMKLLVQVNDGK